MSAPINDTHRCSGGPEEIPASCGHFHCTRTQETAPMFVCENCGKLLSEEEVKGGKVNKVELKVLHKKLAVGEHLLYYRYPAGDADFFEWPMEAMDYRPEQKWFEQLHEACLDARECGELPSNCTHIVLPDGREFKLI